MIVLSTSIVIYPEFLLYDMVSVCLGTNQTPNRVQYDGQDTYTGQIYHTFDYKEKVKFEDQRVLCAGLGESGSDITYWISQIAKETYWVLSKSLEFHYFKFPYINYPNLLC